MIKKILKNKPKILSMRKFINNSIMLFCSLSFMKKLLPKYFDSEWSYA